MRVDHILNLDAPKCRESNLDGFFEPTQSQIDSLLDSEGRLKKIFVEGSLVEWGNPIGILARAAIFRLMELGYINLLPGVNISYRDWAIALADLSVTGENNYRIFEEEATDTSGAINIGQFRRKVQDDVQGSGNRLGISFSVDRNVVNTAADYVIDRALQVIWTISGPSSYRELSRQNLGWIAVDSETDPPHSPVNVPSTGWPVSSTQITINHASQAQSIRIRYSISGSTEESDSLSILSSLPQKKPFLIPDDALLIVFLHGHSSRLEEGNTLYRALVDEHSSSSLKEPLVMLSFDFPTNGYSQYIDHDEISPLESTTRFVPDRPQERKFGLLEFYEKVVIGLVENLHTELVENGHLGILDRIGAVIGGSMGGNLALRLSEKLVTSTRWLDTVVSWSPASVNQSLGRADYFIPSPGEHFDPIGKEALERPRIRCQEAESTGAKQNFFALQIKGERLINDGSPGFEAAVRAIPWIGGIFVGGIVGIVVAIGGAITVEAIANNTALKQSDEWINGDCLLGLNEEIEVKRTFYSLNETYNSMRRRTHWRVAYEQLLFSHHDEVADSRGLKCYLASEIPTMLVAGLEDVVNEKRFNIAKGVQELAPKMINNPGRAFLLSGTGHSIHAEQPEWLARHIYIFITVQKFPEKKVIAVRRQNDRIAALVIEGRFWKEIPVESLYGPNRVTGYFVEDSNGNKTPILYRRFLTTTPDNLISNNLKSLPETNLPVPLTIGSDSGEDELNSGPTNGFQVTHIRLNQKEGDNPANNWITQLCNDELGYQISSQLAEERVERKTAQYFLITPEGTKILKLVEFLTTAPDNSKENNLENLPEA